MIQTSGTEKSFQLLVMNTVHNTFRGEDSPYEVKREIMKPKSKPWRDAMKAAPEGWRLPTRDEIKDLTNLVGITNNILPNAGIYDYSLKHTCIFQQGTAFWTSETYTHRNAYSLFINNDLKYMLCTSMNDCLSVRYVRTI